MTKEQLIEQYARAACWYINATDEQLEEAGETRFNALVRCHKIESRLLTEHRYLLAVVLRADYERLPKGR